MMEQKAVAHVLIFPFPAQGHINSMLKLAELLCLSDIHVTFLNTHHYHSRLFRFTDAQTRFACYPKFRFETISDGLPEEHPRSVSRLQDIYDGVKNVMQPCFRELMASDGNNGIPLTCIIFDGLLSFPVDVAKQIGIPSIAFRTTSACYLWTTFHLTNLLDTGHVPFSDDDMDKLVTCIPGMETFVRSRDLPGFYRGKDPSDPSMHGPSSATTHSLGASASILNTFQHLESPILSLMAPHFPKIHAIGPLHALLAVRRPSSPSVSSSNSLWKIDTSCITWLDSQPSKSVVYVSFGSLVLMTHHQMLEFWYGLVKSGKRFLWVVRPDSVIDKDDIPVELEEATKERGYMVEWSPQEQVLAHPAVGGFVTHSGWNSTLESIVAGVPMLCWPYMGDQQVNSRFVSDVWKIGFDMKDTCDRFMIEKMVNDLMVDRRDEVMRAMDEISSMATNSVTPGGSSYCNFEALVDDLKSMKLEA